MMREMQLDFAHDYDGVSKHSIDVHRGKRSILLTVFFFVLIHRYLYTTRGPMVL